MFPILLVKLKTLPDAYMASSLWKKERAFSFTTRGIALSKQMKSYDRQIIILIYICAKVFQYDLGTYYGPWTHYTQRRKQFILVRFIIIYVGYSGFLQKIFNIRKLNLEFRNVR